MSKLLKSRQLFVYALKIAVGSYLSIIIANQLQLTFAPSAGIITLLTIVTTKWETMKLSVYRVISFAATVLLTWILFSDFSSGWVAYGLYIFISVFVCEVLKWKATVSVNAVIASHFLVKRDYSMEFILEEFLLLMIGIAIAVLLNLFHGNRSHKSEIAKYMLHTEGQLQMILGELATYLHNQDMQRNVWDDICSLERTLHHYIDEANRYQNNTFLSHPQYYIDYFEMRMKQCNILHNLHYEMKKIRTMPMQAGIIADYILYLKEYVTEVNRPNKQMERLEELFEEMKKEPLPETHEEFESRAMLYHILMDIEEFVVNKRRFVDNLDKDQLKIYWSHEKHD
ncbi:MAG: aromatic acid exporter family protein [Lachnospiraceae bacterium]